MNKIIQVKIFNGLLDNFFDFLETISIDLQSDIILTRTTISFIRKSNPRLVVQQFMEYSCNYRREIQNCNESFFLNYQHTDNFNVNTEYVNGNLILKLKTIWQTLDKRQKATVFYYLNKLLNAGDKCLI